MLVAGKWPSDPKKCPLKGCSCGAIAAVVYLAQLMDCVGFSVIVNITPHGHLIESRTTRLLRYKIAVATILCD